MSVSPSVLSPDTAGSTVSCTVAALVYADECFPDAELKDLVRRCRSAGLRLAGVLQHASCLPGAHRCDIELEDLGSGHRTMIFENRGAEARGCRLDEAALMEAIARVDADLQSDPDLLVLNKFGKVEAEGGGMRDLLATAIDSGVPVVIGVPRRNLDAWREFAGDLAIECADNTALRNWVVELRKRVGA